MPQLQSESWHLYELPPDSVYPKELLRKVTTKEYLFGGMTVRESSGGRNLN